MLGFALVCSFLFTHPLSEEVGVRPLWPVGKEYIYQGTVQEELQYGPRKHYKLELRCVPLNDPANHLLFCTQLTQKDLRGPNGVSTSTRLDAADLLKETKAASTLPTDRIATWELGPLLLLHSKDDQLKAGSWEIPQSAAPPLLCKITGNELLQGQLCTVVEVVQQSIHWEKPRADVQAWRRQEWQYISQKDQVLQKVRRVIERRAAARTVVTETLVTEYALESINPLDIRMLEAHQETLQIVRYFQHEIDKLSSSAWSIDVSHSYQQMMKKLETFQKEKKGTQPYVAALDSIKTILKAGADRRLPVVDENKSNTAQAPQGLQVGSAAPAFSLTDWQSDKTYRLSQWKGKPLLLCFYRTDSTQAGNVLFALDQMQTQLGENAAIVGMAMTLEMRADEALAVKELSFPVLLGKTLRNSYEVTETPRFVLIDPQGIIAHIQNGWGPESRDQLDKAMQRQVRK